MFSHDPAGAALYSLISTARANKVEPYQYLRALFERLPRLGRDPDPQSLRDPLPRFIRLE